MLENFVQQLLFAVCVGALPGIEREHLRKKSEDKAVPIFGIRTIILFSVLGFISAYVGNLIGESMVFVLGILAVIVITTAVYLSNFLRYKHTGATTYTSMFIIFFMGFLVGLGGYTFFVMAAVLSIITTLLLAARREMIEWSRNLKSEEIFSAIKFGIIAVIIFPLLPNRYIDPWNLINPFSIWYVIVIISAIFFTSYIFMKEFSKKGLFYSNFFAGLISATGTVFQLTCLFKKNKSLLKTVLSCIFLACFASLLSHILVIILVFGGIELVKYLVFPYVLSMISLLFIFYYYYNHSKHDVVKELNLDSPFKLKSVFTFGGMYLSLVVIGGLLNIYFGDLGLIPAIASASMFSSSAATASLANLFQQGNITAISAAGMIILSGVVSLLVRIIWVWPSKSKEIIKIVATGTAISSAILVASYFLQFILFSF